MKKNADGSLTLYIQKDSPGKDKESNWLPAPDGPIYLVMRLYWPKDRGAVDPAAWRGHLEAAGPDASAIGQGAGLGISRRGARWSPPTLRCTGPATAGFARACGPVIAAVDGPLSA